MEAIDVGIEVRPGSAGGDGDEEIGRGGSPSVAAPPLSAGLGETASESDAAAAALPPTPEKGNGHVSKGGIEVALKRTSLEDGQVGHGVAIGAPSLLSVGSLEKQSVK